MRHITESINLANLSQAREDKQEQQLVNQLCIVLVDYIFTNFFLGCRGADKLFSDNKRLQAEKKLWAIAFTRRQFVTKKDIHFGLLKLETHDKALPPNLGEFLKWCTPSPEDIGFLNDNQAYLKALDINSPYSDKGKGLSPEQLAVIQHAISETGSHKLRNDREAVVKPLFVHNYNVALRDYLQGKLKPINKALEDKGSEVIEENKKTQISAEFGDCVRYKKAMGKIWEILGAPKPA